MGAGVGVGDALEQPVRNVLCRFQVEVVIACLYQGRLTLVLSLAALYLMWPLENL